MISPERLNPLELHGVPPTRAIRMRNFHTQEMGVLLTPGCIIDDIRKVFPLENVGIANCDGFNLSHIPDFGHIVSYSFSQPDLRCQRNIHLSHPVSYDSSQWTIDWGKPYSYHDDLMQQARVALTYDFKGKPLLYFDPECASVYDMTQVLFPQQPFMSIAFTPNDPGDSDTDKKVHFPYFGPWIPSVTPDRVLHLTHIQEYESKPLDVYVLIEQWIAKGATIE